MIGRRYLKLVAERPHEEGALESWVWAGWGTVDPLQLVIKRASVLQISGLSGTAGSKAETLFRNKWALISAFSP